MMIARVRSEVGFTLVELLAAMVALGIILLALTAGLAIGYKTIDQTSTRLINSTDAQFLSIYLPPDIKSADTGTTASITCTGVTITNPVLKLTSNANANGGAAMATAVNVVYWVNVVTGGFQLVRSVCGASPTSLVVARNLATVSSVTVATVDVTRGYSMTVTGKKAASDTTAAFQFTVSGRFRTGIAS